MSIVRFQSPNLVHAPSIIELVNETPSLDSNSEYAYALWCTHFAEQSVVALRDDEVIGFLTGFRSPGRPDTYFLWQTATKPRHGVAGLGVDMIDYAVRREIKRGASRIEASVDDQNKAIRLLMKSLAKRLKGRIEEELLFPGSLLAGQRDAHHDETLMRICLVHPTDNDRAYTTACGQAAEEAMV
ncbi:diaminobutyrate acetyltransferase [uncultured Tateyamaria sp.]|uniref:diaminobutyrate acetyltransferase n=1 Tax=uncultured Tateyamaria sp. TaxID=455651 RepID=UPI0026294EF0|nr:diaminobutyrate acetyltransferase [uncultured Tateyamaria sp.]